MGYLEIVAKYIGYIGTIAGAVAVIWKFLRGQKLARDGQMCQLRADMLRTYYRHKEEKCLRQYEAENFILMYKAYKAMGGNSFIDEVYEHVTQWDIET